jgi:hypothetical protein
MLAPACTTPCARHSQTPERPRPAQAKFAFDRMSAAYSEKRYASRRSGGARFSTRMDLGRIAHRGQRQRVMTVKRLPRDLSPPPHRFGFRPGARRRRQTRGRWRKLEFPPRGWNRSPWHSLRFSAVASVVPPRSPFSLCRTTISWIFIRLPSPSITTGRPIADADADGSGSWPTAPNCEENWSRHPAAALVNRGKRKEVTETR